MLMSLDTSTTSRPGCCSRSARTTPRIWLSALPCGRPSGSLTSSSVVWKNNLPAASLWPVFDNGMPAVASVLPLASVNEASESRLRLTWRALRATSLRPFLLLSSSSSVIIGRKMSCSSKRNSDIGSCISTLVSSTNSLAGPAMRGARLRVRGASAGAVATRGAAAGLGRLGVIGAAATRLSSRSSDGPAATSAAPAGLSARFSCRGADWDSKSVAASREAFWAGGLGSGMGAGMTQQKRRREAGVGHTAERGRLFKRLFSAA
jgi:hypothetical protein